MPTAHSLFPYTTLVRSPIERLRLAKSGQVLVRTQKANTPARCGWNADHAQPFLVIAARYAGRRAENRQKKGARIWSETRSATPGPAAVGSPTATTNTWSYPGE